MNENTYKLTDPELDVVMRALVAQPYSAVVHVVNKLMAQANANHPAPEPLPPQ